eukprot:COSAG02_NODE_61905_length_267_cov_0.738095_1_plen_70_part_01
MRAQTCDKSAHLLTVVCLSFAERRRPEAVILAASTLVFQLHWRPKEWADGVAVEEAHQRLILCRQMPTRA